MICGITIKFDIVMHIDASSRMSWKLLKLVFLQHVLHLHFNHISILMQCWIANISTIKIRFIGKPLTHFQTIIKTFRVLLINKWLTKKLKMSMTSISTNSNLQTIIEKPNLRPHEKNSVIILNMLAKHPVSWLVLTSSYASQTPILYNELSWKWNYRKMKSFVK